MPGEVIEFVSLLIVMTKFEMTEWLIRSIAMMDVCSDITWMEDTVILPERSVCTSLSI